MHDGRTRNRWARAIATLGMAASLSACMVGPDFTRPSSRVAAQWIGETAPVAADDVPATWWQVFGDPTLDELVVAAYRDNLSLQMAGARVAQAQAQLAVSRGERWPQQQVVTGQAQAEQQSAGTLASAALDPDVHATQLGVSASWELDFWGKYRRGIEADRAAMRASLAAYDNALVSLTAGVASSYVNIRTLQQRIVVAQDNVATQTVSLRIAQAQFENGATSLLDVEQARTQLAQTRSRIPALQRSLRTTMNALAVLLGTTPDQVDSRFAAAAPIPVAPATAATGMPKDLLRRRPDVRQAEASAAAQCAAIGIAKANLLPAFSLAGSFGFAASTVGGGPAGDLFAWDNHSASAKASFVFPLFDYGRLANRVRVQDAVFEQAVLAYRNAILVAQQEVEDARASFAAAQTTLATLEVAAAAAGATTRLALARYREGAADYTTVLTAAQLQLDVEDALARGRGDVPLALVSVYRALGGGWELRVGQDLLPEATRQEMAQRTDWGRLLEAARDATAAEDVAK